MNRNWQFGLPVDRRKSSVLLILIFSIVILGFYWSELAKNEKPHIKISNSWEQSQSTGNLTIRKKVAAIIENRKSDNLIPLILHYSSVLGPTWPIVLFTSLKLTDLGDSAPFRAGLRDGQFDVRSLPSQINFTNHKDVSSFLTKPWFWQQLAPADHVLLFQSDSIICANAQQHVDDYLIYDMIGAPIADGMGQGYNGGLSLRNRKKMLKIVNKYDWEEAWDTAQRNLAQYAENERLLNAQKAKEHAEKSGKEEEHDKEPEQDKGKEIQDSKQEDVLPNKRQEEVPPSHTYVFPNNPTPPWEDYEDQWFFKHLADMPRKLNGERGANLPLMDVAKTFAVETVYYDTPLGYHQVGLKFQDKMDEIEKWCPEYHLCTGERFQGAG